jgi:GH15 family glucan-1,4-alpha-glucosidase
MSDVLFQPLYRTDGRTDGYLPIEDHGFIGDGATAALVGRDGTVVWLCAPRFDSPPIFCGLLDHARGGAFRIAPDGLREAAQWYEPDSPILVTEMRCTEGTLRVTDCCPVIAGADLTEDISVTRRELLRSVTVTKGTVRMTVEIPPVAERRLSPGSEGFGFDAGPGPISVSTSRPPFPSPGFAP